MTNENYQTGEHAEAWFLVPNSIAGCTRAYQHSWAGYNGATTSSVSEKDDLGTLLSE
jgi:hypothetical protein